MPFAAWEMPVSYGSTVGEVAAVRAGEGLFDVSHMGEMDIAKRLIDYGYHPPTIYFPLIVPEALDAFVEAMLRMAEEIETDPEPFQSAPLTTPVRKMDEATLTRHPCLCRTPAAEA